jgi:hypothetical protein
MVHSLVPKVEQLIDDDSIVLTIQVAGYMEGKSVEIYGYVTQDNGAFARFSEIQKVGAVDAAGVAQQTVIVPASELTLAEDQPVTIVTWVSEVWPSVLDVDPSKRPGIKAAWKVDEAAEKVSLAHVATVGW